MMSGFHKVYYVSNAGVVFWHKGQGIGIDAFSKDPGGLYPDTPPEIKTQLFKEIAAGHLQWLIFTHDHGDHFCLEDVLKAVRLNQELQIISTENVLQQLKQKGVVEGNLHLIPGNKSQMEPVWIDMGVFRVGFLNSVHEGGGRYETVQNLSLLIEVEGQRLVVPGDAAPERDFFTKIGVWSRQIDCFFMPFPYMGRGSNRKKIQEVLDIRQIFILHQPRREEDAQGWIEKAKLMCERAEDDLPMPVFPEKFGEYELQ